MSACIFISYRRKDSAATCGRICDHLITRFGRDAIFEDVDSIPPGVDFREHIGAFLDQSALALVVIGPQWQDVADAQWRRRLEQPTDLVRLEVEAALQRGIAMIPLLVQGAVMLGEQALPELLRPKTYRNALPVRYDPDFGTEKARVIAAAERIVSPAPASAAVSSSAAAPADRAWDATSDVTYRQTRPPLDNVPEKYMKYIKTVAFRRHRIDVQSTSWTVTQCVLYDGVEVASGKKLTKIGLETCTFAMVVDGVRVV